MRDLYDIIIKPITTEKTNFNLEQNKYVFQVRKDADKFSIKKAIENIFSVKVEKVNVLNVLGKKKRFKGTLGHRSDWRKAIVTIQSSDTIDLNRGVN